MGTQEEACESQRPRQRVTRLRSRRHFVVKSKIAVGVLLLVLSNCMIAARRKRISVLNQGRWASRGRQRLQKSPFLVG